MEILGQTIAHYHILEKLGEGGMGVVYKARDTKLDRLVALKFLPQRVTASETEQARFIQEAKASAALSHPNICPVHSIEEHEGEIFIVMDYIDGQTLRQKMASGQIPLKLAVEIGIQIAEGLGAAHEQGVVHRDVKPENIMIRKDGLVQVMDFGLAKLRGVTRLTKEGSTLGTIGYMSPEQVQGHDVDARTDIFSLGVVLYELVTGELPFKGEREAAITYQIVNVEAPLASSLRPEVSPELDGVIAECLAKDPEERYHFAKEVSRQLKRFKRDSSQPGGGERSTERVTGRTTRTARVKTARQPITAMLRSRTLWIGAGVLIAAIAALYYPRLSERSPVLDPGRTSRSLKTSFSQFSIPSLSSDGYWVAYSSADARGKWDVYFMNAFGGEARRVTTDSTLGIDGGGAVDISPDGSQIAYECVPRTGEGVQIRLVSSLGGASRTLVHSGRVPRWRPDGKRIGYIIEDSGKMRFWTVRSDGDDSRLEFGDSIFTGTFGFSWSPDGKSVAWLRQVQKDAPSIVEIIIRDLTTGNERQLTYDGKYINDVCWARNNEIIYSSNKGGIPDLWGVPAAGGQASQITSASGASGIAISANCRLLVYNQQQTIGHVWIVPVDGSPAQQVTFDDSDIRWPSLSPDGKQIAYMTYGVISRVFMMDRDGTNRRKLSSEAWDSYVPRWSPDGKWISFCSSPPSANDESSQVVLVDPRNPLTPRSIGQGDDAYWVSDTILSITRGTKSWLTPTTGKDPRQFFIDSTWAMPVINGTYIMYCDFRAGREGWWVLPSEHQNDPSGKWDRKITPAGELPMVSQQQLFVFSFIHGGFWKLLLPDGRRERLRVIQSSVDEFKTGGIGNRGKEIVYADSRRSSKLVMIENLFK